MSLYRILPYFCIDKDDTKDTRYFVATFSNLL